MRGAHCYMRHGLLKNTAWYPALQAVFSAWKTLLPALVRSPHPRPIILLCFIILLCSRRKYWVLIGGERIYHRISVIGSVHRTSAVTLPKGLQSPLPYFWKKSSVASDFWQNFVNFVGLLSKFRRFCRIFTDFSSFLSDFWLYTPLLFTPS